jgi:hypothetical protein
MDVGEKALQEVSHFISFSQQRRNRLRDAGWERILNPPLVGNQWIWKHPRWFVQLENEAVRILDIEEGIQGEN